MSVYGFYSESEARTLSQMARDNAGAASSRPGSRSDWRLSNRVASGAWLMQATSDIAAATLAGCANVACCPIPGTGTAEIWKRATCDVDDTITVMTKHEVGGEATEVTVYNFTESVIPNGDLFFAVRGLDGTIWAMQHSGSQLVPFTLTEDIGATTAGQAAATQTDWDGVAISPAVTPTVYDGQGIFATGKGGAKGQATLQDGKLYITQLGCS